LSALKLRGRILALLDGCDKSIHLASRNIPRFELVRTKDANAYDVLRNKNVLLTRTSLNKILERIK
jgi:ribosomal protein L4